MTADQIKRLRELCDAHDAGALRAEEFAELVKLASVLAAALYAKGVSQVELVAIDGSRVLLQVPT